MGFQASTRSKRLSRSGKAIRETQKTSEKIKVNQANSSQIKPNQGILKHFFMQKSNLPKPMVPGFIVKFSKSVQWRTEPGFLGSASIWCSVEPVARNRRAAPTLQRLNSGTTVLVGIFRLIILILILHRFD